ncbi:hypothetical protein BGX27_003444 [Mortierella sp. AM989]|nr:hypothetical protein BGX27_003444 [Mortierella sp. AM989]
MYMMLRQAQSSGPTLLRFIASKNVMPPFVTAAVLNRSSLVVPQSMAGIPQKSRFSTSYSGPTVKPANVEELVIDTVAELLQIKEPADRERITLKTHMKSDLGMDIFKTYQLLDRLEREVNSIEISVEDADKAETLEDIASLVSTALKSN